MIKIFMKQFDSTVRRYYIFMFLKDFAFFSAVLVPFYTLWGHVNLFQIQLLQSWFMFWQFLLDIPTGVIADHLGRKYVLIAGAVIDAVGSLLYGSIPNFTIFLLGEFLMAVAISLINGADNALLYDALDEQGRLGELKAVTGKSSSINLFGMFLSAPIGSLIATKFGLNVPMLMTALPLLLAAIVAITINEPKLHRKQQKEDLLAIAKNGIKFFYNHKTLRLLAFDGIIVASSAYFIVWLYQPLLQKIHIPIFFFGFITPILVGSEMLVSANFRKIERWFGSSKKYLAMSAIIIALAFIITGIFPSIITILLFVIFAGGFGYTRINLMSAYMNKFIPSEQRATILSTISMLRRFVLVILNPLIGFTADHSLQLAFILLGILPLAIFFFSPIEQEMLEE